MYADDVASYSRVALGMSTVSHKSIEWLGRRSDVADSTDNVLDTEPASDSDG